MAEESAFYATLRRLSILPRAYFHLRVDGDRNVPPAGACVLAANHTSYVDPIVLAMACPRPVRFIVDHLQYRRPLVHWIAVRTGAIPVRNDVRDVGSLRLALHALREGAVLGIFPEGGRSKDGALMPGRPGAALLALRAGVPLLPVGIVGAFRAYPHHRLLPRPSPISVRFGPPLELPEAWRRRAAKEHLEEATSLLMATIGALVR